MPLFPEVCTWQNWGSWGSCSKTCGVGTKIRSRQCTCMPSEKCPLDGPEEIEEEDKEVAVTDGSDIKRRKRDIGRQCLGSSTSSASCMENPIVNCAWSTWGAWGSCSRTCGSGTKTRWRSKYGPFCGGSQCPESPTSESTSCNTQCCPGKENVKRIKNRR